MKPYFKVLVCFTLLFLGIGLPLLNQPVLSYTDYLGEHFNYESHYGYEKGNLEILLINILFLVVLFLMTIIRQETLRKALILLISVCYISFIFFAKLHLSNGGQIFGPELGIGAYYTLAVSLFLVYIIYRIAWRPSHYFRNRYYFADN
jgi:hypothetical protein